MGTIGFIGLGIMGIGMASNLVRKQPDTVLGFDLVPALRDRFAAHGGQPVENVEEIAKNCPLIFLSLPSNKAVESSVESILSAAKPGTIIVDLSSTAPSLIRELSKKAAEKGLHLLDSPVSGAEARAADGTLVIMCGGEEAVYETVLPYLKMLGPDVFYMGGSGSGNVCKLVNNVIVGGNLDIACEAIAFGRKAGLDPAKLWEVVRGGAAQSFMLDVRGPKIVNHDFSPSAPVRLHLKDVNNALQLADEIGVELPLTNVIKEHLGWLKEQGFENEDHSALYRYYEHAMGVADEEDQG
ncbi:MAG: NAD(P)-dependent oxidoreductase [Oscillospiraceae bacterium]|nr:NAD(P)-dependent oxidoreductase [Oscillospiraceae bacterium]